MPLLYKSFYFSTESKGSRVTLCSSSLLRSLVSLGEGRGGSECTEWPLRTVSGGGVAADGLEGAEAC